MARNSKNHGGLRGFAVAAVLIASAVGAYLLIDWFLEPDPLGRVPEARQEGALEFEPSHPGNTVQPSSTPDGSPRSPASDPDRDDDSGSFASEVDSTVAEIWEWQAQEMMEPAPYERALRRLLEQGGEAGLKAVLELMTNEDFEFWSEATVFEKVLAPIDSPEIAFAAEVALENRLAWGETGTAKIDGYLKLLVGKGDRGAVFDKALEFAAENPVGTVSASVLSSLKAIDLSPEEVGRLLESTGNYAGLEANVFETVIVAGGEYGHQLIEDLFLDSDVSTQAQLALAIGEEFPMEKMKGLVDRVPETQEGDRAVLDVLVAAGRRITSDTSGVILERGDGAVRRALLSDSPELIKAAMFALRDIKELVADEFVRTIRTNIEVWDPEVQVLGRRLLAAYGRSAGR